VRTNCFLSPTRIWDILGYLRWSSSQVFNKLISVPSWASAWEADKALHQKVQTLHEVRSCGAGVFRPLERAGLAGVGLGMRLEDLGFYGILWDFMGFYGILRFELRFCNVKCVFEKKSVGLSRTCSRPSERSTRRVPGDGDRGP